MNKKTKRRIKKRTKSDIILLFTFVILLLLVITLSIVALTKKNEAKNKDVDITIPVTEKTIDDDISISIDISNLKENAIKEYKMKLTNYHNKEINEKKLSYSINFDVANEEGVVIKLYKDKDTKELLNNSKELKNLSMKKNKKQETIYTVIIKKKATKEEKGTNYLNINIKR